MLVGESNVAVGDCWRDICRGLAEVQREAGWLPCETAGVAGRAGGLRAFLSGARGFGLTPGSSGLRVTSAASPALCGDGGDLGNFTWMAVLKWEGSAVDEGMAGKGLSRRQRAFRGIQGAWAKETWPILTVSFSPHP